MKNKYEFAVKVATMDKKVLVYKVDAISRAESIMIAMQHIINNGDANNIVSVRGSVETGRGSRCVLNSPDDIDMGKIN